MKILLLISACIVLIGLNLLSSGLSEPVYTDPEAPARLSRELQDLPREQRFSAWYQQLQAFETSHKRHTDQGRGLIALSAGLLFGGLFQRGIRRFSGGGRVALFIACWLGIWVVRFPLSIWYYDLRQQRFDYPPWGDSIAIGMIQDFIVWGVGLCVTSVVLVFMMARYSFPDGIAPQQPVGFLSWVRASLLWLWIVLLAVSAGQGVFDGDEGAAFHCSAAMPMLLLVVSAYKKPEPAGNPLADPVA